MSTNPLIQDLIENEAFPSVTVALPTGGRWYKEGVFEEGADPLDLPVGVLGILAEQNYRDPWLLLSGEAIPRMFKSVCPAVIKTTELCDIDLETILLAARLVSYGPKLELTHQCTNRVDKEIKTEEEDMVVTVPLNPGEKEESLLVDAPCEHENVIELDINEHILRYGVIDDDVVAERFVYKLKIIDQLVNLRPMPYHRTIEQIKEGVAQDKQMTSLSEMKLEDLIIDAEAIGRYTRIIDMASGSAIDNITACIHSIQTTNGELVDGDEWIRSWLLALSLDEAEGITNKINDITRWTLSHSEIKYICAKCGSENMFRLELDANRLFGQAGDSIQPKKPSRKLKTGGQKRRIR
jgi:hypothetical protein